MYIKNLSLSSFRNIKNSSLGLKNGVNIIYGDNAQGKTNILESIYICATGRSHRTRLDRELVNFDENEAHIRLICEKNSMENKIDVHIRKNSKKGIAVNQIPIKKYGDLFGVLQVVFFSPEDLNLIKGAPSERRRFMDISICQLNNIYYYNLKQYYNVLKQRNNLLKEIQKDESKKSMLFMWDKQLISFGSKIIDLRRKYIDKVSSFARKRHLSITGGKEELVLRYKPNVSAENFEKKLSESIGRDIFLGSTQVGIHKDEIEFFINGNDTKTYGSQGQQRTAVLCAKFAQTDVVFDETGVRPVLLLDDVFSELDEKRQTYLINSICDMQTLITCTGLEKNIEKFFKNALFIYVRDGEISLKN